MADDKSLDEQIRMAVLGGDVDVMADHILIKVAEDKARKLIPGQLTLTGIWKHTK